MFIVGETLAWRQKSRNVQDRYALAVKRTDTETETANTGSSATTVLQGICMPRQISCLCSLSSLWRYHNHRQAGRRTHVLGCIATQIFVTKKFLENLIFVIGSPYEN